MTTPADPSRPAAPSVREIAALTARLRAISTLGRAVAPAERAQFLADKDALIARITAADTDRSRAAVRERYDAQNAIADAVGSGGKHPGYVLSAGRDVVKMPEWMREQARATEAKIAAGTYEAGPVDDDWWTEQDQHPRTRDAVWDDVGTDGAEPAGRDDPTWWAPAGPDEAALSHRDVAAELSERGFTPEQARAAITEYLDETSQRIGLPVHQWAMDSHDVEAIAHTRRPPVPVPEQRHPNTAEHTPTADPTPARGDEPPDYAGERANGDRPADAEAERREQLARWQTDDTTAGPGRGDGLGEGRADSGDVAAIDAVIVEGGRS